MIFPGFPGVLSFFQVFQVEWEPCVQNLYLELETRPLTELFRSHLLGGTYGAYIRMIDLDTYVEKPDITFPPVTGA